MIRALVRWFAKPLNLLAALGAVVPFTVLFQYMWYNGRNIPRFDQWREYPIVFKTQAQTLTLGDLLTPFGEHITFFSYLQAAIFTVLTDWNLWAEMWVNLALGVIVFVVLLWLTFKIEPTMPAIVLIPVSALVFMVRQDSNWTNGYMSQWFFAMMFWLTALAILIRYPNGIRPLFIAGIFGFFATISQSVGNVTWAAVLVYLLLKPKADWRQITVWLVLGVLSVGYYILSTPKSTSAIIDIRLDTMVMVFVYMLAQVGIVFEAAPRVGFVFAIGVLGFGFLLANLLFLWLVAGKRQILAIWGSIASYGLASAFLIGLGRFGEDGFDRIFYTWYTTPVLPFWIALVVTMTLSSYLIWYEQAGGSARYTKLLLYGNILFAGLLAVLYVPSNQIGLNKNLAVQWRRVNEDCLMRYIFIQDEMPHCFINQPDAYRYNELAARRLALYATREPESILHPNATDQNPILVETHTAWLNTHIRDFFLHGIDRERIHHIYPPMPEIEAEIPNPPEQTFTDFSAGGVDELLNIFGELDAFWYIRRVDYETAIPDFWQVLTERGYLIVDTRERNDGMLVSRVQYVPPTLENSPLFGDQMRMRGVSAVDAEVRACDTLRLQTFWEADAEIDLDYSGSLRLLNRNGEKVAQSDAQLTAVGTRLWELGQLYVDDRELVIPCEVPAGEYDLMLSVYFYQDPGTLLPIEGDANRIRQGNLYTVSPITIR